MSKNQQVRYKLAYDPDSYIAWMDGGHLPPGGYDTEAITGIQLNLMLDGYEDIYVILVLPGDDDNTYDVWVRRMGSTEMLHMLSRQARYPEDVVVTALETLPDYIGLV